MAASRRMRSSCGTSFRSLSESKVRQALAVRSPSVRYTPHADAFARECGDRRVEAIAQPNVDVADLLFGDLALAPFCEAFEQLFGRYQQLGHCGFQMGRTGTASCARGGSCIAPSGRRVGSPAGSDTAGRGRASRMRLLAVRTSLYAARRARPLVA